jgi:hypothetical protein
LALGTWELWIIAVIEPLWRRVVFNNACQGWDISATLQGFHRGKVDFSLPVVGVATVVFAYANYTMQLLQDQKSLGLYTFTVLDSFNYTPSFPNISYNVKNFTYTIDHISTSYNVTPNLSFPSLGLVLEDPSIPFKNDWGPPAAHLIQRNFSTVSDVLQTITKGQSCRTLKVCGMVDPKGDFEIVMGVVMIQQSIYSLTC